MSGSPGSPPEPTPAATWSARRAREAQRLHDLIWPLLTPNEVLRGSFLAATIDQLTKEWGDDSCPMVVGITSERLILVEHDRKFEAYGAAISIRPEDVLAWRGRLPSTPTRARVIVGAVRCAVMHLVGRRRTFSYAGYRYQGIPCGEINIFVPAKPTASSTRGRPSIEFKSPRTSYCLVPALPRPWLGDAQTTGPALLCEFLGACSTFEPGHPPQMSYRDIKEARKAARESRAAWRAARERRATATTETNNSGPPVTNDAGPDMP